MAQVHTILGTQVLIKIGNGGSPETFAHPCLINLDRGIEFTASGNKVEVPDCDDPDAPAWIEFVKQTMEATLTGAGKLDALAGTMDDYTAWVASPNGKNIQIWLNDIGYFQGKFQLTKFGITGTRGNKAEVSLGMDSDGPVVWHTTT